MSKAFSCDRCGDLFKGTGETIYKSELERNVAEARVDNYIFSLRVHSVASTNDELCDLCFGEVVGKAIEGLKLTP